ncbi:MAG: LPS-assembly protein LptD [Alphaproteobacteria bacterium]|nr:LPS-assembly protein LptD [Alphaproteobacteria bacterium]
MYRFISMPRAIAATFLLSTSALTTFAVPSFAEETVQNEQVELAADQITYDAEDGVIRAVGNVLLVRDGYTLKAGEILYNERTGKAEAFGAVELLAPNGDRIVAPRLVLEDELRHAFVEDIRLILADGAQVAASTGERNEDKTVLERAVYSPCKVCSDGTGKAPLWQIKAVKVTHDKKKRRLYYEDASLEFLGLPVLWTPYFSHPDPTVDRASGLLPMEVETTKNLGFVFGVPYYHVFSESADATVTPTVTTKEGLLMKAEYRQHLGFGQFEVDGSITYADKRDPITNLTTGSHEFRGHFGSEGQFRHSSSWRSTYRLNWASDDTYLRRYDISNADTLISEYLLEGFFGRSYVSARAIGFQGLRIEDIAGETGFALPLIDAEFIPKFKPLGGTVKLKGNALALHRTDGLDTQRVSLSAGWQRRWITAKGFVIDADALIRTDAYNLNDADRPDDIAFAGTFGSEGGSEWRNLARVTGTVTWPLVKFTDGGSHTIEPIAEITLSPRRGTPDNIVNEDSRAFELNDLNLFSPERASGFDLWEEGSRLTYGMRWRFDGQDWRTDIMVGQSWRLSGTELVFADGAGLEGDLSDIVGRTTVSYKNWLDFEHRYRVDENSFAVRRNEIDVTVGDEKRSITVGYVKLDRNLNFINREDREEIRARAQYWLDENWQLHGGFTHRLKGATIGGVSEKDGGVEYDFGVAYSNECIELGLRLRETFTRDRDVEPGTSILFRLKLKNLG